MLNIEKSLRLSHFQADQPIVLGNGETFQFRLPRRVIYPEISPDGQIQMARGWNVGDDWDDRIHEAELILKEDKIPVGLVVQFADRMLLRNYREEIRVYYRSLLAFHPDEPDSITRYLEILRLAGGIDPKGPMPDGSKPRSESTASIAPDGPMASASKRSAT